MRRRDVLVNMALTLTEIAGGLVGIAQIGFLGCIVYGSSNDFYTGRRVDREEIINTEKECRPELTFTRSFAIKDRRYVAGIALPFTARELKINEIETQCEWTYYRHLAELVRFAVAERELFPDGTVKVLWDPGNKYKSSTNNSINR